MVRSWRQRTVSVAIAIAMLAWLNACDKQDDVNSPTCSYAVTPLTAQFESQGGNGSLTIQAPGVCAWTAAVTNSVPWIAITSEPAGTGNGVVTFTVAANADAAGRTGTITIGTRSVGVAQAGHIEPTCTFAVDPISGSFGSSGGTGIVGVTAPDGCRWTSTSQAGWILITSGSSGSGTGPVQYAVAGNTSANARTGTFTVAGKVVTLLQAGLGSMCTYLIAPTSATYEATGGSGTITVTAPATCGWAAVSQSPWITVDAGSPATGNGSVQYTVAANAGPARTGVVMVAGQAVTISQASTVPEVTTLAEPARPGAEGRRLGAR